MTVKTRHDTHPSRPSRSREGDFQRTQSMEFEDIIIGDEVYLVLDQKRGIKTRVTDTYRKNVAVEVLEDFHPKAHLGRKYRVPPQFLYRNRPGAFDYQEASQKAVEQIKNRGDKIPPWLETPADYLMGPPITRNRRERDRQRSKVYAAEPDDQVHTFQDIDHIRAYLQGLRKHDWFVTHFGTIPGLTVVSSNSNAYRSVYVHDRAQIRMAHLGLGSFIHELTHHLTPNPYAGHGPLFARTLLELNRRLLGRDFVEQYHIQGVRYGQV